MIIGRNFTNRPIDTIPVDNEEPRTYVRCNFAQMNPDLMGPLPKGHKLFEGVTGSFRFVQCNLMNCEVPENSTTEQCLTVIKEVDLPDSGRDDVLIIDGQEKARTAKSKGRVHARIVDGVYEYLGTPREEEQD